MATVSFSGEDFVQLDSGVGTVAEGLEKVTGQCCGVVFLGLIIMSSSEEIGVITEEFAFTPELVWPSLLPLL